MTTEDKTQFRKKRRSQLSKVSKAEIQKASLQICDSIVNHNLLTSRLTNLQYIATFAAHGAEINLSSLHAIIPEKKLLYPLCHPQGKLSYHHVTSYQELHPGKYGILEPDPRLHTEINISDIELFLCPGLAFGKDGTRLGHGGGYYDRALVQKSAIHIPLICAVALDQQVFDTLPTEDHDIRMDMIVTESGIRHSQT